MTYHCIPYDQLIEGQYIMALGVHAVDWKYAEWGKPAYGFIETKEVLEIQETHKDPELVNCPHCDEGLVFVPTQEPGEECYEGSGHHACACGDYGMWLIDDLKAEEWWNKRPREDKLQKKIDGAVKVLNKAHDFVENDEQYNALMYIQNALAELEAQDE